MPAERVCALDRQYLHVESYPFGVPEARLMRQNER
jgi:hypothetical protein